MKSNEELLDAIYAHFPDSEDKDETMCNLITDSLAAIGYWNMEDPEPKDETKFYYEDRIWEDIKSGRSIKYGDTDNRGTLNLTNILKALDEKGQLIPAVLWSENFFALVPGESRTVLCSVPEGYQVAQWGFSGWNGVL